MKREIAVAVKRYNFISELLPVVSEFIQDFRVLHAQLREGDKLEIRIGTEHDRESKDFWRVPSLNAYFVPRDGEERNVLSFGTWEGGREKEKLLYND